MSIITQYIPDLFAQVVQRVCQRMEALPVNPFSVFFDWGHYNYVANNLILKDESVTQKLKKYPLIWLVMDFDEQMGENPADYAKAYGLHFIIAMPTEANYTMESRRDKVFLPYLYPIYAAFIEEISTASEFGMPGMHNIRHTKTDRPYWGGSNDPLAVPKENIFSDFIDAIQIRNLKLNIKQKTC